jgi:hypothetical protein
MKNKIKLLDICLSIVLTLCIALYVQIELRKHSERIVEYVRQKNRR